MLPMRFRMAIDSVKSNIDKPCPTKELNRSTHTHRNTLHSFQLYQEEIIVPKSFVLEVIVRFRKIVSFPFHAKLYFPVKSMDLTFQFHLFILKL